VSPNDSYSQHVVTAVIVAHDGAAWLPQVIQALLEQTRPVQRVVAVDTGSRDRSGSVLAGLLGQSVVFGMDRGTGYSAAVARALQHRAANVNVQGAQGSAGQPGAERAEWVWLLHDDSEPAPDALEQLLRGAAETRSAAVLGPKVKDWSDRRVILEAGITIDTVGRRITSVEPREVDQGQHDGDRDCLAVGSAGMLVRRDVWDSVGGFDTDMPLFREDVDFCWRVHQAGHRVRVITDAVVYHVEASARRRRPISVARRPRQLDRRNAMLTLAGNLPAGPMISSFAGNLAVSFLRAAFFLVAKRLAAALDEMAAVGSVLGHPLRLLAMRRARALGRRAAYGRLRRDLPPGQSLRKMAEFAAAALSGSTQADTAGSHHATDNPEEADYLLTDTGLAQRVLTSPGVLLFLALTVVSLVAERSLLGSGPLGGGALVPAWGGASDLWREYVQGFHSVGVGSGSSAPPYLALVAALATLLGGKPWLAVDVILLGCVPLAGVSAFLAVRRVTRSVPVRVWAAASYALLPVAMGAIAGGRIGTAVVFVLVPAMALLAGRMLTQPARRARRAAWATGLTIALAAAFVPLVWVVALVAALALVAARPRAWRELAIVAAVPPVLLMPWTLQVAAHPSTLLLEAGLQQPGLADHDLAARSLMLLSPGGPGLPPVWVTAGISLAALAALLLSKRRVVMTAGWGIALSGLVIAIAVSRAVITPGDGSAAVPAWPGVALLIAAVGLLLAGVTAGEALPWLVTDGARQARAGQARGGRPGPAGRRGPRPLGSTGAVILAGAALSAPVLAAASWLVSGVRGPVAPISGPVVPAVVTASTGNGLELRTLVVRSHGRQVSYSLQRGASPSLGDPDLAPVPSAQQALDTAVAALIAPNGGEAFDQGQLLAQFDIGFVLLPAPVDQGLVRALDGVADLRPLSATSAFYLWRVTALSARVRVVEPDGTVVAVPSGPTGVSGAQVPAAGGTIEFAEPAGGWNATLSGRPLTLVPSPAGSWAAAYQLPAGGGVLDIGRDQTGRDLILILQLLVLSAVTLLALPGSRSAADEGPAAFGARAAAGLRTSAGSRATGGTRAAAGSRVRAAARVPPGSADAEGYPVPAGAPLPREATGAGADAPPGGRRARGRPGRMGQAGRASRGQRRDRNSGPGPRRGRPVAEEPGPDGFGPQELEPEELGAGPAGRRPPGGRFPAGGPSGPHAAWPSGQPRDAPSGPHAAWPSGPHAAWPSGPPEGRPQGPRSGWPPGEPAAPVAPPRSPSGSWPPPDENQPWSSGQQAGWPAPPQPSGWPGGRSDVLDPLPPVSGGRHGRRAPDDDEERDPRWPVPEHDSGGDAW
jgi:GT2 family glycosyltransferase